MKIKSWFIDMNFKSYEKDAINHGSGVPWGDDMSIEKQTEKAVLVLFKTDFGNFKKWIPKSCIDWGNENENSKN